MVTRTLYRTLAADPLDPIIVPVEDPMVASSKAVSNPTAGLTGIALVGATPSNPGPILGGDGNNYLKGTADADTIYGQGGNDSLFGLAGNDILDGGEGADVMAGGTGNDRYYVDNIGDVVWEWGGQGNDTVYASVSYTVPVGVETLALTGEASINGFGNDANNQISGNVASNTLDGGAGDDTLSGEYGADILIGGAGNDALYGGAGDDFMMGGTGDDYYDVFAAGDTVYERAGEGTDTVWASVSYTLPENVEKLFITEFTGAASGTGNALNNTILGNSNNNVLDGGAGDDTLSGRNGADTLIGGTGNDTLYGDDGDDTIIGGTETDGEALSGGAGRDTFVYQSRADSFTTAVHTGDIIIDFNTDEDLIDLRALGVNIANLRLDDSGVGTSGRVGHLFEDLNGNGTFDANELNINIVLSGSATFSLQDVLV